jgi:3-oxoacyl-[acyl-carrier protein] reductase
VLLAQSAAKAALQDISRNLAAELGKRGIGVIDVAPGVIRTDIAEEWLADPSYEQDVNAATALGRVGEPEDVADAIVALLSTQARWITGESIGVTGGYRP